MVITSQLGDLTTVGAPPPDVPEPVPDIAPLDLPPNPFIVTAPPPDDQLIAVGDVGDAPFPPESPIVLSPPPPPVISAVKANPEVSCM